jgi:hypothetical protein
MTTPITTHQNCLSNCLSKNWPFDPFFLDDRKPLEKEEPVVMSDIDDQLTTKPLKYLLFLSQFLQPPWSRTWKADTHPLFSPSHSNLNPTRMSETLKTLKSGCWLLKRNTAIRTSPSRLLSNQLQMDR